MPTKKLPKKPRKVGLATKILYLIVSIGIIRTIITVIRHIEVRSPYFLISTKLLFYLVSWVLIYQTSKGRNWARWSLVAILIIHIPLTILPAFESISHNLFHTLLGFLQLGLYILALVLLFHKSSSDWFAPDKIPYDCNSLKN